MNWLHVRRIAWKEMRRLGVFWVLLVALWALWMAVYTWLNWDEGRSIATVFDWAYLMFWTIALYCCVWGALSFSLEHEDRSFGFLQSLPVRARNVFYGKLTFGAISLLAMIGCYLLILFAYSIVFREVLTGHVSTSFQGFSLLEWTAVASLSALTLSIGIFWSMRVKHPWLAITLAIISSLAIPYLMLVLVESGLLGKWIKSKSSLPLACLVVGTTVAFFGLARQRATQWLGRDFQIGNMPLQTTSSKGPAGNDLRRLFWIQFRQSRWQMVLLLLIPLAIFAASAGVRVWELMISIGGLLVGLVGLGVFRSEHRQQRFRLLAQLGVPAGKFWLSSILLPAVIAILISCFMALVFESQLDGEALPLFLAYLAFFSINQFCSIAWPSAIIATGAAIATSSIAALWIMFCHMLQIPAWLTIGPLILLPLFASYLRVSRWFQETGNWRQWVVPCFPLLLMILGTPMAAGIFRATEIPPTEIPERLLAAPAPNTKANAERYQSAFAKVPDFSESQHQLLQFVDGSLDLSECNEISQWVRENDAVVDSLVETIVQSDAINGVRHGQSFDRSAWAVSDHSRSLMTSAVLLTRARHSQDAGHPDAAWTDYMTTLDFARDHYGSYCSLSDVKVAMTIESLVHRELVHWAMKDETTPAKIFAAAEFLETYRRSRPSETIRLAAAYQESDAALVSWEKINDHVREGGYRNLWPSHVEQNPLSDYNTPALRKLASLSPFELIRMRRWNDRYFVNLLNQMNQSHIHSDLNSIPIHDFHCRGIIYQMAAIAVHKETGEYPKSFRGVSIGNNELPEDPFWPGSRLVIAQDDPESPESVRGNYIRTILEISTYFSDASGRSRCFVLPEFEGYSRENFAARRMALKRNNYKRRLAVEADGNASWRSYEAGGLEAGYGAGSYGEAGFEEGGYDAGFGEEFQLTDEEMKAAVEAGFGPQGFGFDHRQNNGYGQSLSVEPDYAPDDKSDSSSGIAPVDSTPADLQSDLIENDPSGDGMDIEADGNNSGESEPSPVEKSTAEEIETAEDAEDNNDAAELEED